MASSQTSICNSALQLLGADLISSINDSSRSARACFTAYDNVILRRLRSHPWNFAIKRASLAASATPPLFGFANAFPLPADFLMLLHPDPNQVLSGFAPFTSASALPNDWQIEGNQILTNDSAPLQIRYIARGIPEAQFDPIFAEVVAADLALAMCEQLTQSNGKKADCRASIEDAMEEARKRNAFENPPMQAPTDSWITKRL